MWKKNPGKLFVRVKIGTPITENIMKFPQNIRKRTTI